MSLESTQQKSNWINIRKIKYPKKPAEKYTKDLNAITDTNVHIKNLDIAIDGERLEEISSLINSATTIDLYYFNRAIFNRKMVATSLLLEHIEKINISQEHYFKSIGYLEAYITYVKADELIEDGIIKLIEKASVQNFNLTVKDQHIKGVWNNAISKEQYNIIKALLRNGISFAESETEENKLPSTSEAAIKLAIEKGKIEMEAYIALYMKDANLPDITANISAPEENVKSEEALAAPVGENVSAAISAPEENVKPEEALAAQENIEVIGDINTVIQE